MSVALLGWIGYHALAVPVAVWAATAARSRAGGLGLALLPLCWALAVAAGLSGRAEFAPAGWLLPVAAFGALVHNRLELADTGRTTRLLHVPVQAWNAGLCAVFALRALQDLAGFDGGTAGTALVGGHADLQVLVGQTTALAAPTWFHLPLCVPGGERRILLHRLVALPSAAAALALLALWAAAMPSAHERAADFRSPVGTETPLRAGQRLGLQVPVAVPAELPVELGLGAVVVEVDLELLRDEARTAALRAQLDEVRAADRTVILIAQPPRALLARPAADLETLAERMAQVHWLAAERLAPDLLILFDGPFTALRECCAETGTVDRWLAVIGAAAVQVRQARAGVRTAVALRGDGRHVRRLCAALRGPASAVDAIALVHDLEAEPGTAGIRGFGAFGSWLREDGGERPVWLLGVGACPASSGGELGQDQVLAAALRFAATEPAVAGLCLAPLEDAAGSARGLVVPGLGRRRLAFARLAAAGVPWATAAPR
jgi:hypothetical protein